MMTTEDPPSTPSEKGNGCKLTLPASLSDRLPEGTPPAADARAAKRIKGRTIYLPDDLFERILVQAHRRDRTISEYVTAILERQVPDHRIARADLAGESGEVGAAYVVVRVDVDDEELRAWCTERLARFKVPKSFHRIEALPRNSLGKVMKSELRQVTA